MGQGDWVLSSQILKADGIAVRGGGGRCYSGFSSSFSAPFFSERNGTSVFLSWLPKTTARLRREGRGILGEGSIGLEWKERSNVREGLKAQ